MAASTVYVLRNFQKIADLVHFLNTGSDTSPGGPVVQSFIVEVGYDPGNGQWFVLLAPGF